MLRPLLTVVVPAWWGCLELSRALYLLIVNARVVPAEVQEVLTSGFQGWITESAAVAALRWILAMDHPPSANLWSLESLLGLYSVTGVVVAGVWIVESWSSNVEVGLSSTC